MKKVIGAAVVLAALVGAIWGVKSFTYVDTGKVGVVYSMKGGVQDEVLHPGANWVSPFEKVKQFTIANEQIILSKDSREGSKEDESFKVATSDDASISISFQMSYQYDPETVVQTYKRFKGMDGEDIVNKRVKTVLKSSVSEVTTDYSMMDIYSGNRAEINDKITEYLNKEFKDKYGLIVTDASIIDVHPDKQLKTAIDKRVTALQEKQQAQAEQEKIKVEAETRKIQTENDAEVARINATSQAEQAKIKAEGQAEATRIKADAEAEAVSKVAGAMTQEYIDYTKAQAWNGQLPTVQGASGTIIDMGDVSTENQNVNVE